MSKINTLLDKISSYEKLAQQPYSSQEIGEAYSEAYKNAFEEAYKLIVSNNGDPRQLQSAWMTNKNDPKALATAMINASVTIHNQDTANRLRELASEIKGPQQTSVPAKATPAANPDVLSVQKFLNQELAVKNPQMAPIAQDGKWGNETAKALALWGKVNGLSLDINKLFTIALGRAMKNTLFPGQV